VDKTNATARNGVGDGARGKYKGEAKYGAGDGAKRQSWVLEKDKPIDVAGR